MPSDLRRKRKANSVLSSVIDIGSNSIKLLVAHSKTTEPVFEALSETRLSPNRESGRERIDKGSFERGVAAVVELCTKARAFSPQREVIVGTSLFRTAENATEFTDAVFRATGTPMRILSGKEEADLIAAGVATDPEIRVPCAIFDLGGGSLEFIGQSSPSESVFAESWPLGAVRMSRRFFSDPEQPIPSQEIESLRAFVRESVIGILPDAVPTGAQAVLCGGAAGICARLCSAGTQREISSEILEKLLKDVAQKSLSERVAIGVPKKRADIFPAALSVFTIIVELCGFAAFVHTSRNLRYGVIRKLIV